MNVKRALEKSPINELPAAAYQVPNLMSHEEAGAHFVEWTRESGGLLHFSQFKAAVVHLLSQVSGLGFRV